MYIDIADISPRLQHISFNYLIHFTEKVFCEVCQKSVFWARGQLMRHLRSAKHQRHQRLSEDQIQRTCLKMTGHVSHQFILNILDSYRTLQKLLKYQAEIKDTGYKNTCFIIQMLLKMQSLMI